MKYLKLFEENRYFDFSWMSYNPEEIGIDAKNVWKKPINNRFNCLVRLMEKQNKESYIFYLEDTKLDEITFMDYLFENSTLLKRGGKISLNEAYEYCVKQLDYYEKLKLYPTEDEIKECLYPFTDESIYLTDDIYYGYRYKTSDDDDNYDLVRWHYREFNSEFICTFIMDIQHLLERKSIFEKNISISEENKELINNAISEFKFNIEEITNKDFDVERYIDSRGLVMVLKINN
jgi:hypothetical protein